MFILVLRELFILLMIGLIVYFAVKAMRKATKQEKRRSKLEEAQENIEETLKEAQEAPVVEEKKLQQARTKIKAVIEEGNKNKGV